MIFFTKNPNLNIMFFGGWGVMGGGSVAMVSEFYKESKSKKKKKKKKKKIEVRGGWLG